MKEKKSRKYLGHPSYSHWNVLLWYSSYEGMYRYVMETSKENFINNETGWKTPDGVTVSRRTAGYTWDALHE